MKVLFIQTGGTIDKDYPKTTKGYAFEISEPAVKRVLLKVNPSFDYEIVSVLKKDSMDITDEDRTKIYQCCKESKIDKIVLTHGTDTMIETAQKLSAIKNKIIIITGAMRPEQFSNSDASFNIGMAVGVLNSLEPGVYIAMNGQVYSWDNVKRDMKTGQFIKK